MLAVGLAVAHYLNLGENRRLSQLEGLTSLLRFFRLQIDCYCVPVGEIFRRCDASVLSDCGYFGTPSDFCGFLGGLTPTPEGDVRSLLESFSAELGSSYRDEQLKSCDYHIAKLCDLRDRALTETKKRKRLNTTLCLCAAGAAVILLF